jgi:hypothetical protein
LGTPCFDMLAFFFTRLRDLSFYLSYEVKWWFSHHNNNNSNTHAYAGTNECFTHLRLRVLLVLQAPRHCAPI